MRVLLDTHTFIWLDSSPEKLSKTALALCQDEKNELYLSIASAWEMQIKNQLGKLKFNMPLSEMIKTHQQDNALKILNIHLEHIVQLKNLPLHHNDPFDRLLLTQSLAENIPIISADVKFKYYSDVVILW
jgi:PIN domain nuclease of toxin-antitoxin system